MKIHSDHSLRISRWCLSWSMKFIENLASRDGREQMKNRRRLGCDSISGSHRKLPVTWYRRSLRYYYAILRDEESQKVTVEGGCHYRGQTGSLQLHEATLGFHSGAWSRCWTWRGFRPPTASIDRIHVVLARKQLGRPFRRPCRTTHTLGYHFPFFLQLFLS